MIDLTMTTVLPLADLRTDGGTQPRASLSEETVAEYAEAMAAGVRFPPVVAFYDGTDRWLADGFHRVQAAQVAGRDSIEVDIRQGTRRDAVLYAAGANAQHGLRRTNADKRRAVFTLLADPEWSAWSDQEIARRCGVDPTWVGRLRRERLTLDNPEWQPSGEPVLRHVADGRTINVANIGKPAGAPLGHEVPTEPDDRLPGSSPAPPMEMVELTPRPLRPTLLGDLDALLDVVGGAYLGRVRWAQLLQAEPAEVARLLVEEDRQRDREETFIFGESLNEGDHRGVMPTLAWLLRLFDAYNRAVGAEAAVGLAPIAATLPPREGQP